jgi:AraC-like DNA-binding protein
MAQDFVHSYLEAWNHRDAEEVFGHFCRDGRYCDIPRQANLSGQALLSYLSEFFAEDRHRYELVGELLVAEQTIAFQYRDSPVDGAGEAGWEGAEFVELGTDGARTVRDYYRLPGDACRRSVSGRRYAKSALAPEVMSRLLSRLDELMLQQHTYLDPDLSLPRLAEHIGCSVNHLSQAINAGHGVSFFDYINGFRIAEAKRVLGAGDPRATPILDIALAVGFNSTSTFYTAFKRVTGQTPAQYRRARAGCSAAPG